MSIITSQEREAIVEKLRNTDFLLEPRTAGYMEKLAGIVGYKWNKSQHGRGYVADNFEDMCKYLADLIEQEPE